MISDLIASGIQPLQVSTVTSALLYNSHTSLHVHRDEPERSWWVRGAGKQRKTLRGLDLAHMQKVAGIPEVLRQYGSPRSIGMFEPGKQGE